MTDESRTSHGSFELVPVDHDPLAETRASAPLTEAQREIWTVLQMGADAAASYHQLLAVRLRGPLEPDALVAAVERLVARHEALRLRFASDGSVVCPAAPMAIDVPLTDLTALTAEPREQEVQRLLLTEIGQPFDLTAPPLLRARLIREASEIHTLVLTAPHIVCDGWAAGLILRDLGALYEAERFGLSAELPAAGRFTRYAQARAESGSPDTFDYWRTQLGGVLPTLDLPTDKQRPAMKTFHGAIQRRVLAEDLVGRLRRVSARHGSTLFALLLATWQILLYRLSTQEDVVVGVPTVDREGEAERETVGHGTNLLPLRARFEPGMSFVRHLKETQRRLLDAQDHVSATFGTLLRLVNVPRDSSRTPMIAVTFNVDKSGSEPLFESLTAELLPAPRSFGNWELEVNVIEYPNALVVECTHNTDLFDEDTVRRWLACYEILLTAVTREAAAPDSQVVVSRLPLVPADDDRLLDVVNETAAFYPELRVDELIGAQASRSPDAMALIGDGGTLAYGELERRANQLARYLQGQGVGRDALVGVCLERSPEMVVALLAILRAGGAYVPLDPSYPAARLEFMARDAQLRAIVTSAALASMFRPLDVPIVRLDAEAEMIRTHADSPLPPSASPDDVAYVIYTSGSTGRPKGVEVTHRNLVNFLWAMREQPGLRADDLLLAVTTISFDISCLELFLPLTVGAGVLIATTEEARDGAALARLLERHPVTVMQATPATWRLLLAAGWKGRSPFKIICGGEALTGELARALLATGADLWNVYGPTETTVWSTLHHVVTGEGPPPIGRPIANTQVHVFDEQRQRVPIGVSGELYIGGVGVARGYLHRPELTAERFVRDPVTPERRLYRTGDLVRMRADGTLVCLGRVDHQVKLRGFRIEPGEIEAALLEQPGVDEAVVVVHDAGDGDRRLVAYGAPDTGFTAAVLREALRVRLPDYMIPAAFIGLPHLPRTPNGKVDRAALPAAVPTAPRTAVHPRTPAERDLARIFCDVLSIDEVSVNDDFFDVGGHSLLAIQLVSRIRDVTGAALSMRDVFGGPTVENLAALIADRRHQPSSATPIQPRRRRAVPMMEGG